jgi:hypothetical protein
MSTLRTFIEAIKSAHTAIEAFFCSPSDAELREEALRWARTHFKGKDEEIAQAVCFSIVRELGVNFAQLRETTEPITDLRADEYWEWYLIQGALEEELRCHFAPSPAFEGQTIGELIDFVQTNRLPASSPKAKGWNNACPLAECLNRHDPDAPDVNSIS